MKVFDLDCAQGHVFEGWFASEQDFQSQRQDGLIECPMCGSRQVQKKLSAPRLNLRTASSAGGAAASPLQAASPAHASGGSAKGSSGAEVAAAQDFQAAWLALSRQAMRQAEDVGPRFADEARGMHYGDIEQRPIRGQASAQQVRELLEEGVPVLPLAKAASTPLQ